LVVRGSCQWIEFVVFEEEVCEAGGGMVFRGLLQEVCENGDEFPGGVEGGVSLEGGTAKDVGAAGVSDEVEQFRVCCAGCEEGVELGAKEGVATALKGEFRLGALEVLGVGGDAGWVEGGAHLGGEGVDVAAAVDDVAIVLEGEEVADGEGGEFSLGDGIREGAVDGVGGAAVEESEVGEGAGVPAFVVIPEVGLLVVIGVGFQEWPLEVHALRPDVGDFVAGEPSFEALKGFPGINGGDVCVGLWDASAFLPEFHGAWIGGEVSVGFIDVEVDVEVFGALAGVGVEEAGGDFPDDGSRFDSEGFDVERGVDLIGVEELVEELEIH
jgi:hypothetical protein